MDRLGHYLLDETRQAMETRQAHPSTYALAEAVTDMLERAFMRVHVPDAVIAATVTAAMRKSLRLALLSALRRHVVQAAGNLRHVLEGAKLAAYAMHEQPALLAAFKPEEDHRTLHRRFTKAAVELVTRDAYSQQARFVDIARRNINNTTAHASFVTSMMTFDRETFMESGAINTGFFDHDRPHHVDLILFQVAQAGLASASLVYVVNLDTASFYVDDDEERRFRSCEAMWIAAMQHEGKSLDMHFGGR